MIKQEEDEIHVTVPQKRIVDIYYCDFCQKCLNPHNDWGFFSSLYRHTCRLCGKHCCDNCSETIHEEIDYNEEDIGACICRSCLKEHKEIYDVIISNEETIKSAQNIRLKKVRELFKKRSE